MAERFDLQVDVTVRGNDMVTYHWGQRDRLPLENNTTLTYKPSLKIAASAWSEVAYMTHVLATSLKLADEIVNFDFGSEELTVKRHPKTSLPELHKLVKRLLEKLDCVKSVKMVYG